nr:MAG TPA: hypothetical protein [Caudoviricetes sp.]
MTGANFLRGMLECVILLLSCPKLPLRTALQRCCQQLLLCGLLHPLVVFAFRSRSFDTLG